jgi:hypothetical protein
VTSGWPQPATIVVGAGTVPAMPQDDLAMSSEPHEPITDLDRKIGRRIAIFRKKTGLTRAELAEQIDSTEAEVAWETGNAVVYATDIIMVCRVLDIEADLLLSKLQ